MPTTETVIALGDRSLTICGDSDDPYFAAADAIMTAQAPLEAWGRRHLPPDAVVIDAGGNIGLTTLMLSGLVPDGQVHVFEPLPANARYLRRNIERNGIRNCVVNAVALGSVAGVVAMQGTGSSSHVAANADAAIPITTLDDYARAAKLTRIDFIKMDVEGFEPAALAGGAESLARFQPPIFMEFNSWCLGYVQGYDARSFAHWLWDTFEVTSMNQDGTETAAGGGDISRFLHDNLVLHGTVDDVLLRVRDATALRRFTGAPDPTSSYGHLLEARRLQALLDAMQRSTSWKITAPMRSLGRALKSRSRG